VRCYCRVWHIITGNPDPQFAGVEIAFELRALSQQQAQPLRWGIDV